MKILDGISYWLDRITRFLITFLLMWMTVVLTLQIAARAIFNSGIPWSEEMARYSMIWLIFLGAAVAAKEGGQISVTALEEKIPALAIWLKPLQNLLSLIYLGIVIWVSGSVLEIVNTQTSANMGIPMSVVYVSIPIGAAIMGVHLIAAFFRKRTKADGKGGNFE